MTLSSDCNRRYCLIHITPDNLNEANFHRLVSSSFAIATTYIIVFVIAITFSFVFSKGWILTFPTVSMIVTNILLCPSGKSYSKMVTQMPSYAKKINIIKTVMFLLTIVCGIALVVSSVLTEDDNKKENTTGSIISISIYTIFGSSYCIMSLVWAGSTRQCQKYILTKDIIPLLPEHRKDMLDQRLLEAINAVPQEDKIILNGVEYIPVSKIYPIPKWLEDELSETDREIVEGIQHGSTEGQFYPQDVEDNMDISNIGDESINFNQEIHLNQLDIDDDCNSGNNSNKLEGTNQDIFQNISVDETESND